MAILQGSSVAAMHLFCHRAHSVPLLLPQYLVCWILFNFPLCFVIPPFPIFCPLCYPFVAVVFTPVPWVLFSTCTGRRADDCPRLVPEECSLRAITKILGSFVCSFFGSLGSRYREAGRHFYSYVEGLVESFLGIVSGLYRNWNVSVNCHFLTTWPCVSCVNNELPTGGC